MAAGGSFSFRILSKRSNRNDNGSSGKCSRRQEEKTVSYDLLRNSLKAVGVVEKNILLFYNGGKCKGGEENDTVEQHQ